MIPKIIHYCWFGGNKLPKLAQKCIKSWEKYCPEYKIICWNEDNFNINECPLYVRQAYENKRWAFVTDYVRLKVVYDYGGIYLDTDVEVIKKLDDFLKYDAFFGFEDGKYIATGLGFGATPNNKIVKEIMEQYNNISFVKEDGTFDTLPCTMRNTEIFMRKGLKIDDKFQLLKNNVAIFPSEYLCPINYETKKKTITQNTHTIHWYSASWIPWKQKIKSKIFTKPYTKIYMTVKNILGEKRFEKFKGIIKKIIRRS